MTEYLKEKWLRFTLLRMPGLGEINYRIICNSAKLKRFRHAH